MPRYLNLKKTAVAYSMFAMLLASMSAVSAPTALGDAPSRRVNFADLDLTNSAGAATLYARIKSAARQVCQPEYNWLSKLRTLADQCTDQAIARAVADVNAPELTTYFMAKMSPRIEQP
jgi:UrcA family protein